MGTGEASPWAELFFGSFGIGMLEGRPKIRRETTRCRQLCDDYIPWTSFKRNYPIETKLWGCIAYQATLSPYKQCSCHVLVCSYISHILYREKVQ